MTAPNGLPRNIERGDAMTEPARAIDRPKPGKQETAMQAYLVAIPAKRLAYQRDMLRRKSAAYRRDARVLLAWTFPESRTAIISGEQYPYRPDITRAICHRLYRDLQGARAMPKFFRRRQARIEVLRELFACECWLYRQQRASVNAQTAMNEFVNGLVTK